MKENTAKKTVRVGAVSPRIRLGDVGYNVEACVREAKRAAASGVRILVFPKLALTGATCRDLFSHPMLANRAKRGLVDYMNATRDLDMISFIGLPAYVVDDYYICVAVVYRGKLLSLVPDDNLTYEQDKYFSYPLPFFEQVNFAGFDVELYPGTVILAPFDEEIKIGVGESSLFENMANILVCPSAKEADIDEYNSSRLNACTMSEANNVAYVLANAGIGESTTDAVYAAHNIIAERGEILAESIPFADDNLITAEVNLASTPIEITKDEVEPKDKKLGVLSKNPFLPSDNEGQRRACLDALEIQSQALAARMERSYSKTMVIGVSGGLDSTLALLVCARAADILGIDRKNIIGVTMPCFGTTVRTKSNAQKLSEALGVSFRSVDIKASVTQHLSDIGHDGKITDVTYENAQARERTQVLMDIANMTGGLVVGTGDLSELVLGWATYNGDHMSMYAVNASVPKTMVRRIVEVYSDEKREGQTGVSRVLDDILATPVSPELLPPKDGEIAQCTEELVGPYELHDFFIYCTLHLYLSPRETYDAAKESLGDVYDNKTILGWLRVFIHRFFSQQFKRSCMPDGPRVGCVSVSPRCGLSMPSDISSAVWIAEIDEIEKEEK